MSSCGGVVDLNTNTPPLLMFCGNTKPNPTLNIMGTLLTLPLTTFNYGIQCPENTVNSSVTTLELGLVLISLVSTTNGVTRFTPADVGRVVGVAKFTPTVNAIRDWCYEMIEKRRI